MHRFIPLATAMCVVSVARAQPVVLDDFESLNAWTVIPSDGVTASLQPTDGVDGKALKLDFDFRQGSGFCVVRRAVPRDLPANYRFSFFVRGNGLPNNLEFKLVDPSGENVWWVNRRAFTLPAEWTRISDKARHFRFAWGPSGGERLEKLGFIEFAVAAAEGGKGSLCIDTLTFEELPPPEPVTKQPRVHFSSASGDAKEITLDESGRLHWSSAPSDAQPVITVDFQQMREFGGLVLEWGPDGYGTDYDVSVSTDGKGWEPAATVRGGNGGRDYVRLPDAEGRQVRVHVIRAAGGEGVFLRGIRIQDAAFGESLNEMFHTVAAESPKGWYPRYFLRKQTPWTVVGVPEDRNEALVDVAGAVEMHKAGFRVEPFLRMGDRLLTWADVELTQSLAEGYLPVPSVTWRAPGLELEVTALADGRPGASEVLVRYRVKNTSSDTLAGQLLLAVRPFQVLPPWQDLFFSGGVSSIESVTCDDGGITVGARRVAFDPRPEKAGATAFAGGEIVEHLALGDLPASRSVKDEAGLASAAARFPFVLEPGERHSVVVTTPLHEGVGERRRKEGVSAEAAEAAFDARYRSVCDGWRTELNRVTLSLPPSGQKVVDTFRSTLGYILINADGPAIQPGSRSYERSWIRDGALTSTALLTTGHAARVRTFLEWYARHQYPDGKVPCVVDARGPDPVPEHDSTGQLIYALRKYYRFTGDKAFLKTHLDNVIKGVDYLESLRNQRCTDEYREGPPLTRACYGLVPESISHEGYSAKPMHSYWDGFFTQRGLEDATTIAQILDRPELEARFAALRDAHRKSLYDSIRLAMDTHGIDYIPGCVELGDFDATSTTIGIFPCGQLGSIPEPQLTNTFERYWSFFCQRRDGQLEWENYTPYELRVIGSFVRLGHPERAHALLDFFFRDQRPAGWNHWAEVVWRDPDMPRFIGDMPHTWVGSDYVNAVRSMFVYERESDNALILAAAVDPEWLESPGVTVGGFPTEYGAISYTLKRENGRTVLDVQGPLDPAPAHIVFCCPAPSPIRSVQLNGRPHEDFADNTITLPSVLPAQVVVE